MHTLTKPVFISCLLFSMSALQMASAQSINDIQEYCQSMGSSGMSQEDAKTFMDDCIAEQSSYLEQDMPAEQYDDNSAYDSSYENSSYEDSHSEDDRTGNSDDTSHYEQEDYGYEQNCYAKVDEKIQTLLDSDPNSEFDYEQLLEQCLNSKP
ncbi:MAG: hypothetical protein ACMZ64_11440 [Oleiphilus sp.]